MYNFRIFIFFLLFLVSVPVHAQPTQAVHCPDTQPSPYGRLQEAVKHISNIRPYVAAFDRSGILSREESEEARKEGIWTSITGRDTLEILAYLSYETNGRLVTTDGKTVDILRVVLRNMKEALDKSDDPSIDSEQIGSEQTGSILSLGEGRSFFISDLLWRRNAYGSRPIDHLQAVDIAYPDHDANGNITDKRSPSSRGAANLDLFYDKEMISLIKEFPRNYHRQLFQELDLRYPSGNRRHFGLIFCNHSLGYVMEIESEHDAKKILSIIDKRPGISETNWKLLEHSDLPPSSEVRKLMDRVIDHLAPGGFLVINPSPKLSVFKDAYIRYLKELKSKGKISDFTPLGANDEPHVIVGPPPTQKNTGETIDFSWSARP